MAQLNHLKIIIKAPLHMAVSTTLCEGTFAIIKQNVKRTISRNWYGSLCISAEVESGKAHKKSSHNV